ncbi:hypothetical protein D9M72_351950 [compost metagenome]
MVRGNRPRSRADPPHRTVAAQQAPAAADPRCRPLPRGWNYPLPRVPGVLGPSLGRGFPGCALPRHADQRGRPLRHAATLPRGHRRGLGPSVGPDRGGRLRRAGALPGQVRLRVRQRRVRHPAGPSAGRRPVPGTGAAGSAVHVGRRGPASVPTPRGGVAGRNRPEPPGHQQPRRRRLA